MAINNASATIEITPKINSGVSATALKFIHTGLDIETGLMGRFVIAALPNANQLLAQNKLPIRGDTSLHFTVGVKGEAGIKIDTSLLGIRIYFDKTFKINPTKKHTKQLGSTIRVF